MHVCESDLMVWKPDQTVYSGASGHRADGGHYELERLPSLASANRRKAAEIELYITAFLTVMECLQCFKNLSKCTLRLREDALGKTAITCTRSFSFEPN